MRYTYRIGLIPRDSAANLGKICEDCGCSLETAGWEDGMIDVYIEADSKGKIDKVASRSWFRYYPSEVTEW